MNKLDYVLNLEGKVEEKKAFFEEQFKAKPNKVRMGWAVDFVDGKNLFEDNSEFCDLILIRDEDNPSVLEVYLG